MLHSIARSITESKNQWVLAFHGRHDMRETTNNKVNADLTQLIVRVKWNKVAAVEHTVKHINLDLRGNIIKGCFSDRLWGKLEARC